MQIWYGCALGLSALGLLTMAITRFGTDSAVDRILCGVGAVAVGWYAYHLLFRYEGGRFMVFAVAFVLPFYVGYRLLRGFRNRAADRAKRQAMRTAVAAAEDWRSTRRW